MAQVTSPTRKQITPFPATPKSSRQVSRGLWLRTGPSQGHSGGSRQALGKVGTAAPRAPPASQHLPSLHRSHEKCLWPPGQWGQSRLEASLLLGGQDPSAHLRLRRLERRAGAEATFIGASGHAPREPLPDCGEGEGAGRSFRPPPSRPLPLPVGQGELQTSGGPAYWRHFPGLPGAGEQEQPWGQRSAAIPAHLDLREKLRLGTGPGTREEEVAC